MTSTPDASTPPAPTTAQRVRTAIDELAAAGLKITTRAVRDRAGTSMQAANDGVVLYRAELDSSAAPPAPPIPALLRDNFAAAIETAWTAAVTAARGEHAAEASLLTRQLEDAATERAELIGLVDTTQAELDAALATIAALQTEATRAQEAHATALAAAQAALDAAEQWTAELGVELQAATTRTTAAEARSEALAEALAHLSPTAVKPDQGELP